MVHADTHGASQNRLKVVERLDPAGLDRFVEEVLVLRARRRAPVLPAEEARLLALIGQGLPPEIQRRYDDLLATRRDERLTVEEHAELLRLTDQVEERQAERVQHLADLARLRGVSLAQALVDGGRDATGAPTPRA